MKPEICAVKNDMENSISTVKGNISALETKINAGKEELRQEISAFQERIRAGQAEFEERVTCTVDTRLKNVSSMVKQQTRNLREDISRNIEATRQDFETQQARTRRAGGSSAEANADKVKPRKFDGSTSWVVFHRQFDAAAAHLLSVLQGQAADVLHNVPAEAAYEDIVGALQDRFGDH
jgi:FtsZ-binding cell division protein ZapB